MRSWIIIPGAMGHVGMLDSPTSGLIERFDSERMGNMEGMGGNPSLYAKIRIGKGFYLIPRLMSVKT